MAATVTDMDVAEQRAALAEACGLKLHRGPSGRGYYYDADGEMAAEEKEWQPDWVTDQAIMGIAALFVIGELRVQPDDAGRPSYQFCGILRTPPGRVAEHLRGKICDSASETMFDACLKALERRRAWASETATA